MDEQLILRETEASVPDRQQGAMAVAVLLFVALYLWGLLKGLIELSQRESQG
jgi:hypothetical protein